jgi:hypothetical protein
MAYPWSVAFYRHVLTRHVLTLYSSTQSYTLNLNGQMPAVIALAIIWSFSAPCEPLENKTLELE